MHDKLQTTLLLINETKKQIDFITKTSLTQEKNGTKYYKYDDNAYTQIEKLNSKLYILINKYKELELKFLQSI